MINKRLSDLSCNEDEFKRAKPVYENALKESEYKAEMKYETSENINNRNRQRKILWFNPFQHQQHLNVYVTIETKLPAPLMGVA